jgi:CSLREA domain-containing protein
MKKLCALGLLCFFGALVVSAPFNARAAPNGVTFTVNTIADEPDAKPGDGKCKSAPSKLCTLRAAVMETNALAGKDTIVLPANAAPYTLTYTGPYNDNARTGDLDILDDLVMQGGGASGTVIDGYYSDRILHVLAGKVKISKVKIAHGSATGNFNFGGGIHVESGAQLTLVKSIVESSTSWQGGGLYNAGKTTLKRSTLQQNSVIGVGGGIVNESTGNLRLDRVTVKNNSATLEGGGIRNNGELFISASTIDHNTANNGAGISQTSTQSTALVNSTIANNTATQEGGGIYSYGDLSLYHVTVASNQISTAGYGKGAGIYQALTGTASLWSTLFDWNTYVINTPPFFIVSDCEGVLNSFDYNFLSNRDNCTINGTPTNDQYNAPAYSGFLGSNGGPTQTISLPFDSPAVDVVPARNCIGANLAQLTVDQRNQPRPRDGNGDGKKKCDTGAFER